MGVFILFENTNGKTEDVSCLLYTKGRDPLLTTLLINLFTDLNNLNDEKVPESVLKVPLSGKSNLSYKILRFRCLLEY